MVDALKIHPELGFYSDRSYNVLSGVHSEGSNTIVTTHPVDRINTLDVGFYVENLEAYFITAQDQHWNNYIEAATNSRALFITSDDIDLSR